MMASSSSAAAAAPLRFLTPSPPPPPVLCPSPPRPRPHQQGGGCSSPPPLPPPWPLLRGAMARPLPPGRSWTPTSTSGPRRSRPRRGIRTSPARRRRSGATPTSCSSVWMKLEWMGLSLFSLLTICLIIRCVLKKYPSKFIGCCLANPADDGSGIKQLEHLIVQEKYPAVRFNPNLWPSGQKMTNEVGRSLFAKAGELGAPVGIMVMKGISLYVQEIEELCRDYPETTVVLDHMAFCKPPTNDEEEKAFCSFLNLSRFPQVYVKYSALFRITREAYPYEDTAQLLSRAISNYGANRIMWGSDFPYVVPECGYKGAKEAVSHGTSKISVSPSDLQWILGKTVSQLFQDAWVAP